jgi:hypothetical protein
LRGFLLGRGGWGVSSILRVLTQDDGVKERVGYHGSTRNLSGDPEGKTEDADEDEESGPAFGVVKEAKVVGNVLRHPTQIDLKAAQ